MLGHFAKQISVVRKLIPYLLSVDGASSRLGITLLISGLFATLTPQTGFMGSAMAAQNDESLPSIREIERAWKQREARIKTLECEWTEEKLIPAGSHTAQEFPSRRTVTVPKKDVEFTNRCLLKIGSGNRYRYESDGKRLINRIQQYADCHFIANTDGTQARSLWGEDQSGEQRYAPLGFIRKNENVYELMDLANGGALLVYCRPSAKEVRSHCSLDGARVRGRENVNGRTCVLVEHGQQPRITQIAFDLNRDFVPVRLVRWSESRSGSQFEMFRFEFEYEDAATGPASLVGWKLESFRSENEPLGLGIASVTRFEINPAIPDSAFQLEFSPGTKVVDLRSPIAEMYIVRPDGSKRLVTQGEADASVPYKTLLNTEPQEFPLEEGNRQSWWRTAMLLSLTVLGIAAVWWRFTRQRG